MKCMYDCGFSIILEVKTVLVFYVTDQQNFIPTKISVSTSNVLNFFFLSKDQNYIPWSIL